jgi:uncharacterized protein YkwD
MNKSRFNLLIFLTIALFSLSLTVFAQKTKKPKSTKIASTPQVISTPKVASTPQINSTQKVASLTKIQQEIFDEINFMRQNPQEYAKILEDMKKSMKGQVAVFPDGSKWQLNEGLSAIEDAINELKKSAKVIPFEFSSGMSKAAEIQIANLQDDISLGHFGKDGSDVETRLYKFGTPGERYSENIAYYSKDARSIVLNFVIDDGLKSRSHRKNLLSTQFKQIGIGYGFGKKDVPLCVIVFADRFTERAK